MARTTKPKSAEHLVACAAVDVLSELASQSPEATFGTLRAETLLTFVDAYAAAAGWDGACSERVARAHRHLDPALMIPELLGPANEALLASATEGGKVVPSKERKRLGAFYTPFYLAEEVTKNTLDPVIRAMERETGVPAQVLSTRICDPACGGGVFLIAVVRQLARYLVDNAMESDLIVAKRLVAIHCVYGVDKNPWSVEISKAALMIECRAWSMPEGWLSDNIKVGDALVGLSYEQIIRGTHKNLTKHPELPIIPAIKEATDRAIRVAADLRRIRMRDLSDQARAR